AGKTVYIVGLGLSGKASATYLSNHGAHVFGWDDQENVRKQSDIPLWDPAVGALPENCTALFLSPGIPHKFPASHPAAIMAIDQKCPNLCDMVLLHDHSPHTKIACITGTNGKSTVTSLLGQCAHTLSDNVAAGGNLGPPAVCLPALALGGWYVIETSSYQAERMGDLVPAIAINLNIAPDHLDRYATMDDYAAAKAQLFWQQDAQGLAIMGIDDKWAENLFLAVQDRGHQKRDQIVPISGCMLPKNGAGITQGWLIDDRLQQKIIALADLPHLPGWHNAQNLAACWCAAHAMGCSIAQFCNVAMGFKALEHRQTLVRTINKVRFVNDSKATNSAACAASISAYENVHLIAGGMIKEDDLSIFSSLAAHLSCVYCIGRDSQKIADACKEFCDVMLCEDLENAVKWAWENVSQGNLHDDTVILLAPAAASFDQFENFGHRGKVFADLVWAIADQDS
ncbi:MAG: UDP-N-acetylmuramoyl-L-alanine--D-glutamate ligase, partial [Pseudomonadota bacterium]